MSHNRIMFVISELGCGGAQRVLVNAIQYADKKGLQVDLVTFSGADDDFYDLPEYVERFVVGRYKESKNIFEALINNIYRIYKIRKIVTSNRPKTVFGFIGITNILVILACYFTNVNVVISERNDPGKQSLGKLWDLLRRLMYKKADIVTANSESALLTLSEYVDKDKLLYLPNIVSLNHEHNSVNLKKTSVTLLAVGRLHPQKAYDVLLNAMHEVLKNNIKANLLIVGDGYLYEELKKYSAKLNIESNIEFIRNTHDIDSIYRKADLFILSSKHEGMPNVFLEALTYRLPVIISDALTGPVSLIKHKESGLIFKSGDSKSLAECIRLLLNDKELRIKISSKSKDVICAYMNSESMKNWNKVIGVE